MCFMSAFEGKGSCYKNPLNFLSGYGNAVHFYHFKVDMGTLNAGAIQHPKDIILGIF